MAERPKRVQRKRTAGWRMPAGAVYVGRPTVFGNPFRKSLARAKALRLFKLFIRHRWKQLEREGCHLGEIIELQVRAKCLADSLPSLRGKDLACWCPLDQPCHADILLEIANG